MLSSPTTEEQTPSSTHVDDAFEAFWSTYPRKVKKGDARKAWAKATKEASPQDITDGAVRYAADCSSKRTDARYIAHPTSWLNSERWTDEPDQASAAADAELERERRMWGITAPTANTETETERLSRQWGIS